MFLFSSKVCSAKKNLFLIMFYFIGSQQCYSLLLQTDKFLIFLGFHSNDWHELKLNFNKTAYNKISESYIVDILLINHGELLRKCTGFIRQNREAKKTEKTRSFGVDINIYLINNCLAINVNPKIKIGTLNF